MWYHAPTHLPVREDIDQYKDLKGLAVPKKPLHIRIINTVSCFVKKVGDICLQTVDHEYDINTKNKWSK